LEIVICTAYSDHSWQKIQHTLGTTDRLLILKKPFDKVEVQQLALAVTEKWNLRRMARLQTQGLQELVRMQTHDLQEEQKHLRLIQAIAEAANEASAPAAAIQVALDRICAHTGWPLGHALLCAGTEPEELVSIRLWHVGDPAWTADFRQASEELRFAAGIGLPGRVLSSGRPAWIEDVGVDPNFPCGCAAQAIGLKAAIALPLLVGPNVVGVLEFFSEERLEPDADMLEMLRHLGTQLGRVIERQRSHDSLRRSEEHFRRLTENALDVITILNIDGTIRYQSPSIERVLGYPAQDFSGKQASDFIHAEDLPAFVQALHNTVEESSANMPLLTFRCRHRDGSWRVFEGRANNLLADPVVAGLVLNSRDVTERKRLEEQFLQSQKVQAIGQLAGGVAHDFNNILTAIIGYTDLLLKQLPAKDGLHLTAEEIKKAATRAASLTRQLLAFSRKQVLQPRVLDLNSIVSDMDKMLRRLLGEHIDLVSAPQPDLGRVKADPSQIEQVIMNLAVNARDAMSDHGKLTIETDNVTLDAHYCQRRPDVSPGEYVMLALSDNGCGMAADVRAHLFEPFFTTKEIGQGTGLGLATCHGIIKQSGGHIAVYSEVNQGTTFKIFLPRVYEALAVTAQREPVAEPNTGTETVLLVEDEPMLRELGLLVLSGLGYRVLSADNGVQALHLIEKHRGQDIHLLVTDVVMPEMGGKELAERLRVLSPHTRVLFCSGYTEDAIVHDGTLDPGISFVQKPYTVATLANKVREVLELVPSAERPGDTLLPRTQESDQNSTLSA
jgi:PAS domain S-box-containing protein